jgi:superfamily II DNA or RNA helicase
MATHFFTNQEANTLLKKFQGLFATGKVHEFDALAGYFRASGYFHIRSLIADSHQVRILAGINVDGLIQQAHLKGQLYLASEGTTRDELARQLIDDIQSAHYARETEEGIWQFIEDIGSGKLLVKAHPSQRLHSKIYIFRAANYNEHEWGAVITGSSNLTDAGLAHNFEFNVELRNHDDVQFASHTFQKLWDESTEVLPVDVRRVVQEKTYLADNFSPHDLFIKMLAEYFGKRIDIDPNAADIFLPRKFKKLSYQNDAAQEGYDKLLSHHGFILADVVGLGKTIIACIIAKRFIFENGHQTRILVVFPPALKENWQRTVSDFDIKGNVEFITGGSLHRIHDADDTDYGQPDSFDLIIVDESHKFRNSASQMYQKLETICRTPRRYPSPSGDRRKKVMLLSATPLNNHPADIANQVYLFQEPRNATVPVPRRDLLAFFKPLIDRYEILRYEKPLNIPKVKALFDEIRQHVVEPLVIRRTRRDIERNADYKKDLDEQNVVFPKIEKPVPVRYVFNAKLSKLFDRTVTLLTRLSLDASGNELEVPGLDYYRYRATEFLVKEADRKAYGNAESTSRRLAGIMKTLLVKRLESSFHAFKISLSRFRQATANMLAMFKKDQVYVAPDLDVNRFLYEGREEDLVKKLNELEGTNNRIFRRADFRANFPSLLQQDLAYLDELVAAWAAVEEDPKWDSFLHELTHQFLHKTRNPTGKLVIFSESTDTTNYLRDRLAAAGYEQVLAVHSGNRRDLAKAVQQNFDANQPLANQRNEYPFILTTEVLAEGVNLHRSNVILNYDVPWNSTRLMQRIGRVNRVGTAATHIYIYNFYPTDEAEAKIRLTDTALRKLQAFHTAFGEDSQIYSPDEEVGDAGLYGSQLKEERNQTLELLQELRDFRREHPADFTRIRQLPPRARLARAAAAVPKPAGPAVPGTTLTYLKSPDHPGAFYLTGLPDQPPLVLDFLKAAALYRAAPTEQRLPDLGPEHHQQVQTATLAFQGRRQADLSGAGLSRQALSNNENKALSHLQALLPLAPDAAHTHALQLAITAIQKGGLKSLSKGIVDFTKNKRINDPAELVRVLTADVLQKFGYGTAAASEPAPAPEAPTAPEAGPLPSLEPLIVLSESYR